ncbi:MAG: sigma-54-dependent Fis family transcriptional regulator, partial [Clostridiales bacterium]|nr:sigma-54-dependent Fis family transcriptional regulator [Clostridiales bacterium]
FEAIKMPVDCIKITFESKKIVTCKTTQQIDDADAVENMKSNEQPVVYLFVNEHLEELCKHVDFVVDRGSKESRKDLTRHLVPKKKLEKMPLLRTNYSSEGKATGGIKTLFMNIERREIVNTFIVGLKKEVFDKVWSNTEKENVKKSSLFIPKPSYTPTGSASLDSTELRILRYLEGLYGASSELEEEEYIGGSDLARLTRALILAAAKSEAPVLILGDTGTGKEVVARAIHNHSIYKDEKFTSVNCGAISKELLEYELYGGDKNITHSKQPLKEGLWEVTGKGTLFLDEIGDLSLKHQVKILHALENNIIRHVGGIKDIKVEARILAATNRNLFAMVQSKDFREDLYYRLRGSFIRTPTLKNHLEDVSALALFFWRKITKNTGTSLSFAVLEELSKYAWPGNVRELKMVLTHLYSLFKREDPSVTNLKDIFYLEGRVFQTSEGLPVSIDEVSLQSARCLQHLKRAHEVIHLCHYKFKGSMAEEIKSGEPLSSIRESLLFLNHEIELLCNKPTLFHDKEIFSAVYDFKGKISYLLSLLSLDRKSAIEFLEIDVVNALDSLLLMISHEIEKIMSDR